MMTEAILAVFCISEKSAGQQLLVRKAHFHSLARKRALYFSRCCRLLFQLLLLINLEDVVTSRVRKKQMAVGSLVEMVMTEARDVCLSQLCETP